MTSNPDSVKELFQTAQDRIAFVKAHRERFAAAFIAETGLKPSEAVMFEKTSNDGDGITTRIWFEKRESGTEYVIDASEAPKDQSS